MRRVTAIQAVLFSGITACSGTEAQVPFDGPVADAERTVKSTPAPRTQRPASEPIASEPNVPWSIALLADIPERPVKRPVKRSGKVTIVQADAQPSSGPGPMAHEADVHLALDPDPVADKPVEEKPAAPKVCSGVVNRRS